MPADVRRRRREGGGSGGAAERSLPVRALQRGGSEEVEAVDRRVHFLSDSEKPATSSQFYKLFPLHEYDGKMQRFITFLAFQINTTVLISGGS